MFNVRGRSAATGFADEVAAQIWNPHATQRIMLVEFMVVKQAAGAVTDSVRLQRSTVRGTPASTVTPDIDNHFERSIAPPSGALLDLADFSTEPTLDASALGPTFILSQRGSMVSYAFPGGHVVPPGTGIAISTVAANFPISEVTFTWLEDW
jgi:hypothetical protein